MRPGDEVWILYSRGNSPTGDKAILSVYATQEAANEALRRIDRENAAIGIFEYLSAERVTVSSADEPMTVGIYDPNDPLD